MASKSTLIFIALFLLITKMGSSFELVDDVQSSENHGQARAALVAPAYAPFHAPIHAPAKAPIHGPKMAPLIIAPAKSPIYSAPKPPASHPPHGCVAMCLSYCRPVSPKRACMRTCTSCCAKFKCVPGFTKCTNWSKVEIHGHLVKCPSYNT